MKALLEKFNKLKITERALVFVGLLALTFMLWDATFQSYVNNSKKQMESEKEAINREIRNSRELMQAISEQRATDPNVQKRAQVVNLTKEVARLDEHLKSMTVGLIPPKQMAELLENVLVKNRSLNLVGLKSINAKPLSVQNERDNNKKEGGVYMHGMVIDFEGNYFDTLDYLSALEKLPWQLYWGGIDYKVTEYPTAHVSLTVYTLSLTEGWIGT